MLACADKAVRLACAPFVQVYAAHSPRLPQAAAILMLDALAEVAEHSRDIDADLALRRDLAAAQAEGKVGYSLARMLIGKRLAPGTLWRCPLPCMGALPPHLQSPSRWRGARAAVVPVCLRFMLRMHVPMQVQMQAPTDTCAQS